MSRSPRRTRSSPAEGSPSGEPSERRTMAVTPTPMAKLASTAMGRPLPVTTAARAMRTMAAWMLRWSQRLRNGSAAVATATVAATWATGKENANPWNAASGERPPSVPKRAPATTQSTQAPSPEIRQSRIRVRRRGDQGEHPHHADQAPARRSTTPTTPATGARREPERVRRRSRARCPSWPAPPASTPERPAPRVRGGPHHSPAAVSSRRRPEQRG